MNFSHRKTSLFAVVLIFLCPLMLSSSHPAFAATETILHTFTCSSTDGCGPAGGLTIDSIGNLYGTTFQGGAYGQGVVFELNPFGKLTVLHSFSNQAGDGTYPFAGVVLDSQGNLWGTTSYGGTYNRGIVFELTPAGTESFIYSFTGGTDGGGPMTGLVLDNQGNLFGTTYQEGGNGCGSVFKLVPSTHALTTLYAFSCGADGSYPTSGVVLGPQGNLYGTTQYGGSYGFGTVFMVTESGKETVVHSFTPTGRDGFYPYGGVFADLSGNLYGGTQYGGAIGIGAIFEVTAGGTESILHSFKGGADGINLAFAGYDRVLTVDKKGNLYGVTGAGGTSDLGTVFRVTPGGIEKTLHSFADDGNDGYYPNAGLALDSTGKVYGTTSNGGSANAGTVFTITP